MFIVRTCQFFLSSTFFSLLNIFLILPFCSDTSYYLSKLEQNSCVQSTISRWNIQVERHGVFFSKCLNDASVETTAWDSSINNLHSITQLTTNQVQNQGLVALAEAENFTGQNSFYDAINRRFRNLLSDARPYLENFEELRSSIVAQQEYLMAQVAQVSIVE